MMTDLKDLKPALDVVSGLASIVGLGVTFYVLYVAKGARRAAEGAKLLAQRRNLVEELEEASQKLQQVKIYLQQEGWLGAQIRTDEVLVICRVAMARWPDRLSEERRNGVLNAQTMIQTMSVMLTQNDDRKLAPQKQRNLMDAHSKALGHINDALGEARLKEEREGAN